MDFLHNSQVNYKTSKGFYIYDVLNINENIAYQKACDLAFQKKG